MDIHVLKNSEWSDEYEKLRRNRMVMGAFRYGPIQTQEMEAYDYLKECRRRLRLYEETLNLEHLVDCGNMLMLEYIKGKKDGLVVEAIDDGTHNSKTQ